MTKKKFRLVKGRHVEMGEAFVEGQVVSSEIDLQKVFGKEKFVTVSRAAKADEGEMLGEAEEMAHTTPEVPEPPKPQEPKQNAADGEPEAPKGDFGADVTADYPLASKVGVRVFKKGRWYNVLDQHGERVNGKALEEAAVAIFLEDLEL